jgi:hypothetical protein
VSVALGLALLVVMARAWRPSEFVAYLTGFNLFQLLQLTPLLGLHFLLARDAAAAGVGRDTRMIRAASAAELATAATLGVCVAGATAAALGLAVAQVYPAELRPDPLVGRGIAGADRGHHGC